LNKLEIPIENFLKI